MIQPIEDALRVLAELSENLLISYRLERADRHFELVTDYPEKAPGSHRAFLRLRFGDVSDFERIPGTFDEFQRFFDGYAQRDAVGSAVVQRVDSSESGGMRSVRLDFGTNFGAVAFKFRDLSGESRSLRASAIATGSWVYHDATDGSLVDCTDPFR